MKSSTLTRSSLSSSHVAFSPLLAAAPPLSRTLTQAATEGKLTQRLPFPKRPENFLKNTTPNTPPQPNQAPLPPTASPSRSAFRSQTFTPSNLALTVTHYLTHPSNHPSLTVDPLNLDTNNLLYISVFTFSMATGYHVNSHTPLENNLIPTEVLVDEANWNVNGIYYPPGTIRSLRPDTTRTEQEGNPSNAAANSPTLNTRDSAALVSVYEGKPHQIAAFMQPRIPATNVNTLPLTYTFAYQICSETFCYPPQTLSHSLALKTAPNNAYPPPPKAVLALLGKIALADVNIPYTPEAILEGTLNTYANNTNNASNTKWGNGYRLLFYLSLAFLGGLILNVMPCVLPVVYLKLFSLLTLTAQLNASSTVKAATQSAQSTKPPHPPPKDPHAPPSDTPTPSPEIALTSMQTLRHALLSFGFGIYAVFVIMTIIALSLRLTGAYVGWGFQFQNPLYVFTLIFLTWYLGLYLFDLYNIPFFNISYQTKASTHSTKEHFVLGMLTALLATPCTAPLLAPAIGYLFSRSWWELALAINLSGFGLAFPYWLGGLAPRFIKTLLKLAPKPGPWMETLKRLFAFSLILISLWLINILFHLSAFQGVYTVLFYLWSGTLILFFTQPYPSASASLRQNEPKPARSSRKWPAPLGLAGFIVLTLWAGSTIAAYTEELTAKLASAELSEEASTLLEPLESNGLIYPAKPLTAVTLTAALNRHETIYVHISAEWCLSCKVNEKLVLNTETVQTLFEAHDVTYLVGDWTRDNPFISAYLKSRNRAGIPFDAIYNPKGEIVILSELLTVSSIRQTLEQFTQP